MPLLEKQTISNFLRSDCLRRLRLDLSPDTAAYRAERAAATMPPRQVRPGLQALAAAGQDWENQKLNDLSDAFGRAAIVGNVQLNSQGRLSFGQAPLLSLIPQAQAGTFVVQAQFAVGNTFRRAFGVEHLTTQFGLQYSELRPDIIQVCTPGSFTRAIEPSGNAVEVTQGDIRRPLRVIDIKLTSEASVPYFVEAAYYNVALAGWLVDNGLDNSFYVACSTAVWPGSHDAAAITQLISEHRQRGSAPTRAELDDALGKDLEIGEYRVFAPRLRRFFADDLPRALGQPWTALPWHVDNRCIGCEYLGFPWPGTTPDPNHCWTHASQQDHLSRVAFVSRGARNALEENQIGSVAALAATQPTAPAFDSHHSLRATRTVIAGRASALATGTSVVPPQSGTSAVMPAWADLRIYLTADFDIGSGISVAFGISSVWACNTQSVAAGQHFARNAPQVFPVDQRSLQVEARELTNLLNAIDAAMQDAQRRFPAATVQVYIWDTVTYEHFVRVIGRHLATFIQNRQLRRLAWLFPPEAVVPNPDLSDRMSPVTIVRDVIKSVVATPVPHYYSLLNVARAYHSVRTQAPFNLFAVPSLFEDPLSDQVPSERAHEIWSRSSGSRPWAQQLQQLDRTIKVRLSAIESVVSRIGEDLQGQLNRTAPRITDLSPPSLPARMADDARLWFIFSQLNTALQRLENQRAHAMPPHEREARFKSAHLTRRLVGADEQQTLTRAGLNPQGNRWVYELSPRSTEVSAKAGDFTFALSPFARPGFLSEPIQRVAGNVALPLGQNQNAWTRMDRVTQVTVVAIDRDAPRIVVDLPQDWLPSIQALEQAGVVDFARDVMLDPVHRDFFLSRLEATLNAIGNPPLAINNAVPGVTAATGQVRRPSRGTSSPAAEVLWDGASLYASPVARNTGPVRQLLAQNGLDLNPSQWRAWETSLGYRLRLIWGPPGTGKSRTLRAITLGAMLEAQQSGRSLRVLISGPTYEAIDNVVLDVASAAMGTGPLAITGVTVARLRSSTRVPDPRVPAAIDIETRTTSAAYGALRQRLQQQTGITLVGATAQQTHRLLNDAGGAVTPLFDLILIDEASQMDVANSSLPLAGLAPNGAVVVAGDPKQLPPIHQAEPPLDLDYMVGPVFTYLERRFGLAPEVLEVNYRSCHEIVSLAHLADYPATLQPHSPDLQLHYVSPISAGATPPANWPANLSWSPEWAELLDAARRASCFVYPEGRSSQWNEFEAQTIAAMCWLLANSLGGQLANERSAAGVVQPVSNTLHTPDGFWTKGVGIVTPHRAQQALVVGRLQAVFPQAQHSAIRAAVDTVERFQGQQRDVMIASFALGDPDAISDEDKFLLSMNRFNVMTSRARAKLVVLVSQEVVDHLSSDADVLRGSALLKEFAELFCAARRPAQLSYLRNGIEVTVDGSHRWHP
ncbi:MAG: AAA family ATPase [Phycisphaeraceae bacterium]|nr:AAA family ATPase [Phycisphaerales bacterium]MCB9842816.1 AAA family ATPase [Phycisphaeraceae bacterium]